MLEKAADLKLRDGSLGDNDDANPHSHLDATPKLTPRAASSVAASSYETEGLRSNR
ncbi:MAG: hypothetical protein ACRDRY_21855 [Pseudonocardiaceae bacterium]